MAGRPTRRDRREKFPDGRNSRGVRTLDTRLPVQPHNPEGSDRDTDLWIERCLAGEHTPVPDDEGRSANRSGWEDTVKALHGDGGGLRAGSDGDRPDSNRGEAGRLPYFEGTQCPQLPDVSYRHWQSVEEATALIASDGVRDGDGVLNPHAEHLDRLLGKALINDEEIFDMPLPPVGHAEFGRILAAKSATSTGIKTAVLKANENVFRRNNADTAKNLYALFKEAIRPESAMTLVNPAK